MIDNAILDGFKEIDDSKNLSQLVRSNAPQYWQYMKDRAERNCLRRYLPFRHPSASGRYRSAADEVR
jgi:cation diffusion facilitator CzcD-associated flavoprotein CzcO